MAITWFFKYAEVAQLGERGDAEHRNQSTALISGERARRKRVLDNGLESLLFVLRHGWRSYGFLNMPK